MKTETDTYIQQKQEHYDQDIIKSYSSYISHTPARTNTQTNSIPLSYTIPPILPQFCHPPFLGIFGKVNPPLPYPFKNAGIRTCANILGQNDSIAPAGTPFGNFIHMPSSLFQISYTPSSFQITHIDIMIAVEVKMQQLQMDILMGIVVGKVKDF